MMGNLLRDVAGQTLPMNAVRATVYSGVGPFFDNKISRHPDEVEEEGQIEFENEDDPIILDFWDEWTTMASLVRCGYLKLFEKVPTFGVKLSDIRPGTDLTTPFPVIPGVAAVSEYREVNPEELQEPTWKPNYVPIADRKVEYKHFRK
jgi:hypothetical protein